MHEARGKSSAESAACAASDLSERTLRVPNSTEQKSSHASTIMRRRTTLYTAGAL